MMQIVVPHVSSRLFLRASFALPFERVLQRVRIQVEGRDVLVALPCSGTASIRQCLAFVVSLNALYHPNFMIAALWGIAAFIRAIVGYMLRISVISVGLL
tara:strand:- start:692 stop:991 length:300 start_codon:yes stop_codon:yes gene_type:complete